MTVEPRFSARTLTAYAATALPATLAVRAAADGQPSEILLYDAIGPWGITASDFVAALGAAGAGLVRVRINSPGGSVFDGLAIHNAMLAHPGGVECVVDGIAASAASFIALAGKSVAMNESSMMMIHNAHGVFFGNRNDLRNSAAALDKVDGTLAAIYAAKTGGAPADMAALMDAETWMTAAEAAAAGFCDSVIPMPTTEEKQARASAQMVGAFAARAALRAAAAPIRKDEPAVIVPPDNFARDLLLLRLRIASAT